MRDKDEIAKKIDTVMQNGSYGEMIAELAELELPMSTNNVHAKGGKGGRAISLTYVDNYSTLMLVYTFLLNYSEKDKYSGKSNRILNESLLQVLKQSMEEQKQYRHAFLDAVNMLNDSKEE